MILTTTPTVEGKQIVKYHGIVFGEVISLEESVTYVRDMALKSSGSYKEELIRARQSALEELVQRAMEKGANAVVGIDIDYNVLGQEKSVLITASGTAVTIS